MISNCSCDIAKDNIFAPATAMEFRFIVSDYTEAKGEILKLRNANRLIPKDIDYLDWRYQQLQGAPQPLVFLVISESGVRVGMASLIFRRYWIDGTPNYLAILGDISLDAEVRGIGLGRRLLLFMTEYIDSNLSATIAFVMPNSAAQKCLNSIGWQTVGNIVPHVFLLNPSGKLLPLLKFKWLVYWVGRVYTNLISQVLALSVQPGCLIQLVDRLDDSFDSLWQNYPRKKLILRDRGIESLSWRFLNHPEHQIQVASVVCKGELLGYVAFEVSQSDREVVVHDLVVAQEEKVGCVIALFTLTCRNFGDICTIRMLISDKHPIRKDLSRLGFVRRTSQYVFQIHSVPNLVVEADFTWALTWGDKDI